MHRQLEPELMDSPAEAIAYDQMDHSEVNQQFVDDLLTAYGPIQGPLSVLDIGTGTALIPIELCRRDSRITVTAVDAAQSMLDLARSNIDAAGLAEQIELQLVDAKQPAKGRYQAVISNSLVHHLPEPAVFFENAIAQAATGGLLFVRDLCRPATESQWLQLIETYAGNADADQRKMFADSLHAALTLDELRDLVAQHGFAAETLSATSDRHWTWSAKRIG